jgi:hypothetical protein
MTHSVFKADPAPGNAILAELASCLIDELLLASMRDSISPKGKLTTTGGAQDGLQEYPELQAYLRRADERKPETTTSPRERRLRHLAVIRLIGLLEKRIGLAFQDTVVPFVTTPTMVERRGYPLGGYLRDHPGFGPFDWVLNLFARWDDHHAWLAYWWDRSADSRAVSRYSRTFEATGLLRGALYCCWHGQSADALAAAADYIIDLVVTGLCRYTEGAAAAFAGLLRAGATARTPEALVRLFYGRLPAEPTEWASARLNFPTDPVPLTTATMTVVNSLVLRAYAQLDQTRTATNFDEWFTALVRAWCLASCLFYGLRWASPQMSLGLRTLQSQFSDIDAECAGIVGVLAFDDMTAIVEESRRHAARFRACGDTTGDRFARTQMVIPRWLIDSHDPLPREWLGPTWRTASVLPHDKPLGDLTPQQALVVCPEDATQWRALATALAEDSATGAAEIVELMSTQLDITPNMS